MEFDKWAPSIVKIIYKVRNTADELFITVGGIFRTSLLIVSVYNVIAMKQGILCMVKFNSTYQLGAEFIPMDEL